MSNLCENNSLQRAAAHVLIQVRGETAFFAALVAAVARAPAFARRTSLACVGPREERTVYAIHKVRTQSSMRRAS